MNATNSADLIDAAIRSLHANEVSFITTFIQIFATLVTALFTAWIAVRTAFGQNDQQFKHKVIYEGWKDFQDKLFIFSTAFSEYTTKVQWLKYILDSQDNSMVNGRNRRQYRFNKWQEVTNSYLAVQKAYVMFLRSFETHEIIFISLLKMKKLFQQEYRNKVDNVYVDFLEKVFPEMYGSNRTFTISELKNEIDQYWKDVTEVSVYLDDFRIEIQNETVGKIMKKRLKHRVPDSGHRILTRNGFFIQR